ncbi:MAG: hypothetical protein WBB07_08370 [Mycobacterium sp.]
MTRRFRWGLAVSVGVLTAFLAYAAGGGDMGWPIQAARDIIAGRDPYAQPLVDETGQLWPTNPVTTIMLFLPLAWAPDTVLAAIVFGGISGLLAFGLTREGALWPLLTFASPAYISCLINAQWAPLVLATFYLPNLLPLALVKPSIALPVLLTRLNLKRGLGCVAIVVVSFILCPWWWPADWLSPSMTVYTGFTPILTVPGFLVLLALVRWRDKRAWILVLAALVPQRIPYDQLLLWLIPQNAKRSLILSASLVIAYGVRKTTNWDTETLIVVFGYLVCLAFVVWPPASEGKVETEKRMGRQRLRFARPSRKPMSAPDSR